MTRLELLTVLVARARSNGFEFRRWYTSRLGVPWISAEAALSLLDQQRRYYALVFSREFATAFWNAGADITFTIPQQTYRRSMPDGSTATITRKAFQRRSSKKNAWQYHLREMAIAEDPLRYLRRYLNVDDSPLDDEASSPPDAPELAKAPITKPKRALRAIPTDLPAFLKRPYEP
jgi:hypothetical protein